MPCTLIQWHLYKTINMDRKTHIIKAIPAFFFTDSDMYDNFSNQNNTLNLQDNMPVILKGGENKVAHAVLFNHLNSSVQ